MTLSQKLLLGVGAVVVVAVLASSSAAQAATSAGGAGPQAGDQILVATASTGAAGQIFIRSNPITLAAAQQATASGMTTVGSSNIVSIAQHGDTLTATGQTQVASDGSTWWQVTGGSTGATGWADSTYLTNQGQAQS